MFLSCISWRETFRSDAWILSRLMSIWNFSARIADASLGGLRRHSTWSSCIHRLHHLILPSHSCFIPLIMDKRRREARRKGRGAVAESTPSPLVQNHPSSKHLFKFTDLSPKTHDIIRPKTWFAGFRILYSPFKFQDPSTLDDVTGWTPQKTIKVLNRIRRSIKNVKTTPCARISARGANLVFGPY